MNGKEPANPGSGPQAPQRGSGPGALAARYRSLFEIGRGGMGTIEVALEKSADGFERIVALKRLHPHGVRERRQTEAFAREARLAVWLVHPNVVHAFDFGELDGALFLAMEYVEGETLASIVRVAHERTNAPMPPALVASILADACEGLHAAHELRDPATGAPLNVIHRDVSPHNVMVSYEGHVKLLDFGVARMDSVDPLTRTGEVKGKTAYMSPEQAMGDPLDRRSDLFSVGAVLFECVSGRRMWGYGTDLEVMRKLALESPPSLADAAPLAPPELIDLCARLLAKAPADRPATAREVADELRTFVAKSVAPTATAGEMMRGVFGSEASERKAQLDRALVKAGQTARLDVLRRSLAGPTALAALTAEASGGAAAAVEASPPRRAESMVPRATRGGVVASAIVGLAIAVGIVGVSSRWGGSTRETTATSTSTSTSNPTPTPTPTSTSTSTPSVPAASNEDARVDASVVPPPPRRRHTKPAPATSVDVDTNPL